MIHPGSLVHARCRDDESIPVPTAGRISPPSRLIGVHQRLTPIGPDGAHSISPLELLNDPIRQSDHFDWIGINQSARRPHGIAVLIRIAIVGRRDSAAASDRLLRMCGGVSASQEPAIGRVVRVEHLLAQRSQGRDVGAESAIAAVAACSTAAVSAGRAVARPDAGQIVFVVWLAVVSWIVRQDAAATGSGATLCQQEGRQQ